MDRSRSQWQWRPESNIFGVKENKLIPSRGLLEARMNVQYSVYLTTCDFQDPGSHPVLPSRSSVKSSFALGLLLGMEESCLPSRILQAYTVESCCSFTAQNNSDGFAHQHGAQQELGFSEAGKKEGWGGNRGKLATLLTAWVGSQGQLSSALWEMMRFLTFAFMPNWDITLTYSNFVKKHP